MAAGGLVGAAGRQAVEQALPAGPVGWPVATTMVNLAGAAVLGALLEGLAAGGPDAGWRRQARLLVGTGGCGAFTTWSTLAVEVDQLGRHGHPLLGAAYLGASTAGGLLAAAAGVAVAARARAGRGRPPVPPPAVVGPSGPDPDR